MSSIKQRLAAVEHKRHGGVVLAPDGEPVIKTAQGYQYNGLFYESLKDLDPGTYRLIEGPPVPFGMFWENAQGLTWPAMIQAMINRGEIYKIVE
ncbi:MAG: hypothetical protein D4R73_11120 [Deltaproteobacteria bacterium]|nr:MAG: hypothetical protein D4R73_11120 [Deltaproteobacteria bacterium]